MEPSTWIALTAVVIAALSLFRTWQSERKAEAIRKRDREFIDEERRLRSVAFDLEHIGPRGDREEFLLWNTGTQTCWPKLDTAELAQWAVDVGLYLKVEPGTSGGSIWIRPDPALGLPPSLTIIVKIPFDARRVVRVPRIAAAQSRPRASIHDADDPDAPNPL